MNFFKTMNKIILDIDSSKYFCDSSLMYVRTYECTCTRTYVRDHMRKYILYLTRMT